MNTRKKQISLYTKTIMIELSGTSEKELQEVAQTIHIAYNSHKLCKGTKSRKKVCAKHTSTEPIKVFDGLA